jgi:hypothetical protein
MVSTFLLNHQIAVTRPCGSHLSLEHFDNWSHLGRRILARFDAHHLENLLRRGAFFLGGLKLVFHF